MTPKEYNEIKDADTALAVRLAVTMGWRVGAYYPMRCGGCFVWDSNETGFKGKEFNPFTDASIPYALPIDTQIMGQSGDTYWVCWFNGERVESKSKTHAIINAFCQADPMGHWAAFSNGNKQAALAEAAIKVAAQVGAKMRGGV